MKRILIHVGAALSVVLTAGTAYPRDLGVLVLPVHQGKWTSSVLYEHLKLRDDFDTRGRVDFKSDVIGAQFNYGITDQIALLGLSNLQLRTTGSGIAVMDWASRDVGGTCPCSPFHFHRQDSDSLV